MYVYLYIYIYVQYIHIHIHNDYISKQILIMIHTNRGGISSSKRRESDMGHDQHSGGCFMYHRSLGPKISPKGLCLGNDSFKDPYNVDVQVIFKPQPRNTMNNLNMILKNNPHRSCGQQY